LAGRENFIGVIFNAFIGNHIARQPITLCAALSPLVPLPTHVSSYSPFLRLSRT